MTPPGGFELEKIQDKPLVSIIITVYNYKHYLSEAIESALNQTYRNIEVIVVDDGSIDGPKEIVDNYPIKYVFQEHKGVSSAKNRGISISNGEFFVCLDADDKLNPRFIKKTLAKALKDSRIGFVYTGSKVLYENLGIENIWLPDKIHTKYSLFAGWHGPLGCVLVRRKAFDSLSYGFDEKLHSFEDLDLCYRLLSNGWKAAPVFEPLHWYRLHKLTISRKEVAEAETYLNSKYWFRRPYRCLHAFYDLTIGRICSFILNPIQYIKGLKIKARTRLLLDNLRMNDDKQQIAQRIAKELFFTIDMYLKWYKDIKLREYYRSKATCLQSKLSILINEMEKC